MLKVTTVVHNAGTVEPIKPLKDAPAQTETTILHLLSTVTAPALYRRHALNTVTVIGACANLSLTETLELSRI